MPNANIMLKLFDDFDSIEGIGFKANLGPIFQKNFKYLV